MYAELDTYFEQRLTQLGSLLLDIPGMSCHRLNGQVILTIPSKFTGEQGEIKIMDLEGLRMGLEKNLFTINREESITVAGKPDRFIWTITL